MENSNSTVQPFELHASHDWTIYGFETICHSCKQSIHIPTVTEFDREFRLRYGCTLKQWQRAHGEHHSMIAP